MLQTTVNGSYNLLLHLQNTAVAAVPCVDALDRADAARAALGAHCAARERAAPRDRPAEPRDDDAEEARGPQGRWCETAERQEEGRLSRARYH